MIKICRYSMLCLTKMSLGGMYNNFTRSKINFATTCLDKKHKRPLSWSAKQKSVVSTKCFFFFFFSFRRIDCQTIWGRFHKSWGHGANHRDSSIKVGSMVQSALYASKRLLKSWAQGAKHFMKLTLGLFLTE